MVSGHREEPKAPPPGHQRLSERDEGLEKGHIDRFDVGQVEDHGQLTGAEDLPQGLGPLACPSNLKASGGPENGFGCGLFVRDRHFFAPVSSLVFQVRKGKTKLCQRDCRWGNKPSRSNTR